MYAKFLNIFLGNLFIVNEMATLSYQHPHQDPQGVW